MFCSRCGNKLQANKYCEDCKVSFTGVTEVKVQPYIASYRKRLWKALKPVPQSMASVTTDNVPLEVFKYVFGRIGKSSGNEDLFDDSSSATSPDSPLMPGTTIRVVCWKKEEIDMVCGFEYVDRTRAFGAASILLDTDLTPLSYARNCAVVIPPMMFEHTTSRDLEQTLTIRFSQAVVSSKGIHMASDQCLNTDVWLSPRSIDAKNYVLHMVASYPSEMLKHGVAVPGLLMRVGAELEAARKAAEQVADEERRRNALAQWASKSTGPQGTINLAKSLGVKVTSYSKSTRSSK